MQSGCHACMITNMHTWKPSQHPLWNKSFFIITTQHTLFVIWSFAQIPTLHQLSSYPFISSMFWIIDLIGSNQPKGTTWIYLIGHSSNYIPLIPKPHLTQGFYLIILVVVGRCHYKYILALMAIYMIHLPSVNFFPSFLCVPFIFYGEKKLIINTLSKT